MLLNDHRNARGLSSAKPGSTVAKLAEARKTPTCIRWASIDMGDLFGSIAKPGARPAADLPQAGPRPARRGGRDWPRLPRPGPKAIFAPSAPPARPCRWKACLEGLKSYPAILEEATDDATKSMDKALSSPAAPWRCSTSCCCSGPTACSTALRAEGAEISTPP